MDADRRPGLGHWFRLRAVAGEIVTRETAAVGQIAPRKLLRGDIGSCMKEEPQEGGPITLVGNGDRITIEASKNTLSVALTDGELAARRKNWEMPPYKAERGTLAKYTRLVKSASEQCVTDQ